MSTKSASVNQQYQSYGVKYFIVCSALVLGFINFVACGAQMYQVSMDDDMKNDRVSAEAKDPASPSYGVHAPKGWTELPVHFKTGTKLTVPQQLGLKRAMTTWEMAVGRQLFVYEGIHDETYGDSFDDLYSSLPDNVNGHYLDNNWTKTGKPPVVLATTIWDNDPGDLQAIDTADIRFNGDYYHLGDALSLTADDEKEVVDMETLALHELGHLLGLAHVSEDYDSYSIMGASLYIGEGLENRRLSKGDIERIQKIYGCGGSSCDVDGTLALLDEKSREDYDPSQGLDASAH